METDDRAGTPMHFPQIVAVVGCYVIIAILIYGGTLQNEFVHFDDDTLIFENPAIQEFTPRSVAWAFTHFDPELYIPLTFVSYQIDHTIAGLHPFMFHFTNLLLHTLNALLVFWFVSLLTRRKSIALFCGLLFLVHPLHTEAVAWASGRKDLLSAFFFLLSLVLYLLHRPKLSLAAFLLALLSKASVLPLPFVLLLIDWKQGRPMTKKLLIEKIPYFILALIFGSIALFGKRDILADSSALDTVLMAGKSTVFYLEKLIIPTKLAVIYPWSGMIMLRSPDFFLPVIILITLITFVGLSFKWTKECLFAGLFFLVMLAPSFTNFAKAGETFFASDRYAYLPSIAVFLLLGIGLWRLGSRRLVIIAGVIIAVVFSILSFEQSKVWATNDTLFSNVIRHYDDSYMAHYKVCAARWDEGNYEEALKHCHRSIELKENPRAYYNLGLTYLTLNRNEEALTAMERAVALDLTHVSARINLGYLYSLRGDHARAIEQMEAAVALAPRDTDALLNLAVLYLQVGRPGDARLLIERVLEIDPGNAEARQLLE